MSTVSKPRTPTKTPTTAGKRGGKPAVKTFNGVLDAVLHGNRIDEIRELQKVVARAIDEHAAPKDLAALTKRLQDLSEEYERLTGAGGSTHGNQHSTTPATGRVPVELKAL